MNMQGTCQSCGAVGPNLWACLQVKMACLCSWMVDGERKRSVSVSSQQEQFGIDHCLFNGLTVLSRILVDY